METRLSRRRSCAPLAELVERLLPVIGPRMSATSFGDAVAVSSRSPGSELANIYLHARYYDPVLGMFLSPDPAGMDQNAYRYSRANPVNLLDPSGLMEVSPEEECLSWVPGYWDDDNWVDADCQWKRKIPGGGGPGGQHTSTCTVDDWDPETCGSTQGGGLEDNPGPDCSVVPRPTGCDGGDDPCPAGLAAVSACGGTEEDPPRTKQDEPEKPKKPEPEKVCQAYMDTVMYDFVQTKLDIAAFSRQSSAYRWGARAVKATNLFVGARLGTSVGAAFGEEFGSVSFGQGLKLYVTGASGSSAGLGYLAEGAVTAAQGAALSYGMYNAAILSVSFVRSIPSSSRCH